MKLRYRCENNYYTTKPLYHDVSVFCAIVKHPKGIIAMTSPLMNLDEVAALMRLTKAGVNYRLKQRRCGLDKDFPLPTSRKGHRLLWLRSDVEKYVTDTSHHNLYEMPSIDESLQVRIDPPQMLDVPAELLQGYTEAEIALLNTLQLQYKFNTAVAQKKAALKR